MSGRRMVADAADGGAPRKRAVKWHCRRTEAGFRENRKQER